LDFPTKRHWRQPSKEGYLHAGLKTFRDLYRSEAIESIAFPLLGARNGGLDPARTQEIMET
jgi:O-acetyl-ADP-ribose deacetylase (regulator of RNase III)